MSRVTNFPNIPNTTLQRLFDAMVASCRRQGGTFPAAAPNSFTDRLQTPVPNTGPAANRSANPATEVSAEIRSNPNGTSATVKVRPLGPAGVEAIEGNLDLPTFLAQFTGADSDFTSFGTAVLVADTVNVAVPNDAEGNPGVPVGSTFLAMIQTPGGIPKLLSVTSPDVNHITINSSGNGYGVVLESAGVQATLVAGTKTFNMANVAGDLLAVKLVTSGGTPGELSVVRVSNTQVKVDSWLLGTGIQTLDTSTVEVYDMGQEGHDTSTVLWAVIRPS